MDTITVCETCGSENVRNRNGNVGFCEDCDAPCTTVEVEESKEKVDLLFDSSIGPFF